MFTLLLAGQLMLIPVAPAHVGVNVSFYCGCARCCGVNSPEVGGHGHTTSGSWPVRGLTVAAPRNIPFGTPVCIEGVGVRSVQDRGGSIVDNRIDVYVRDPRDPEGRYDFSHQRALELGRRALRAWVLGTDPRDVISCTELGTIF